MDFLFILFDSFKPKRASWVKRSPKDAPTHSRRPVDYVGTHLREKKKLKKIKLPCPATITLDTVSGILIPAAINVNPITESGTCNVFPGW